MEIIDTTHFFNPAFKSNTLEDVPHLVENNLTLEDSDSMYDTWVNPENLKNFAPIKKEKLVKKSALANEIQLNLKKENSRKFVNNLMKQHSIQISLFEAILLHNTLKDPKSTNWNEGFIENKNNYSIYELSNKNHNYKISHNTQKHEISVFKDNELKGKFSMDIEKQVIEKIQGRFDKNKFIIDPIWVQKQTTIDAVKLLLGEFKTEIVHHPKHKQTLWRSQNKSLIMAISMNKTYQINRNLFVNVKRFEWPKIKVKTIQWHCPWLYFPIQGNYFIKES